MPSKQIVTADGSLTSSLPRLNRRQREAVEYCAGPLLVIAGPGTGKTRVITEKVIYLIEEHGYAPESILALTFTEKAAEEMADRIRSRLAEAGIHGHPLVQTFHGFCFTLVQEHADRLGFRGPLRLLVGPLYIQFIVEQVDSLVTKHTNLVERVAQFAKTMADFTSRCHDEGLIGPDLADRVENWAGTLTGKDQIHTDEIRDLAASVPKLLVRQYAHNVVAYGDLLTLAVRLLRENEDLRRRLQDRFQYVLVDELQDNNTAQFQLVQELADRHQRILVVGDEDQSIYRFRGASLGLLERFRRHWQERRGGSPLAVVHLEENYRSTPAIIATCQALIQQNRPASAAKCLRPADGHSPQGPEIVALACLETEELERRYLVQEVLRRIQNGRKPGDIAGLCRSLAHVHALVADLRQAGIAVEVVGAGGLFGNGVVREVLAWLKTLDSPSDQEIALHRVLRLQGFGLSHADQLVLGLAAQAAQTPMMLLVEKLAEAANEQPSSLIDLEANGAAAELVPGLSPKGRKRLVAFYRVYQVFRRESHVQIQPDLIRVIGEVLEFTGLKARINPGSAQGRQNLSAYNALLQAAQSYQDHYPAPSLHGFIRFLHLLEEVGHEETVGTPTDDEQTVKVMTVHQAKGREFPVVIVGGLSDRFPSPNRREWYRKFLDHATLGVNDIDQVHQEEERRVLYVALSRAKEELLLSWYEKRGGRAVRTPSPFPEELLTTPSVRMEQITAERIAAVPPSADALRTRQAVEARLSYLISRLGMAVHGDEIRDSLREALRLFASLLAERAGPDVVREALAELNLPQQLELEFLHVDGPAGVTGPLHLSASSLNDYQECPRRYYYKHVVHIPEAVSFEARLGTAIHRALELFHQRHQWAKPGLLSELLEHFDAEVRKVEFQNETEREQGLERGRQILTHYLTEEADRSTSIRRMEVEKEFTLRLGPDVTLCGKIDRLDELVSGRFRIVDYKTGELKSRPDYLKGFQMPTYAWAVMEALGREPETVEVIGLKELKQTAKGACIDRQVLPWNDGKQYALTPERLEKLKTQIQDIVQGVRGGTFAAAPDEKRCGWCAYRLLCDQAWGSTE